MLPSSLDVPSSQNTMSYSGTHLLQEVLSDTQPHPKQHQAPPLGSHSSLHLHIPALSILLPRLSVISGSGTKQGRGPGKAPDHHRIPSISQHRAGSRAGCGGVPGAVDRIRSEQVLPGPPAQSCQGLPAMASRWPLPGIPSTTRSLPLACQLQPHTHPDPGLGSPSSRW